MSEDALQKAKRLDPLEPDLKAVDSSPTWMLEVEYDVYVGTCIVVFTWRTEDSFVDLVLSLHLYVGSHSAVEAYNTIGNGSTITTEPLTGLIVLA